MRVALIEREVTHIKSDISDVKNDVREIKKNSRSDFKWLLGTFAGGFLVLSGYMWHVSDKIDTLSQNISASTIQALSAHSAKKAPTDPTH